MKIVEKPHDNNIDGMKVMINVDQIKERMAISQNYDSFIESNRNTIFTAHRVPDSKHSILYVLDDTMWHFWIDDLIVVMEDE